MSEAAESTSEPARTDTPSAIGRVVVGVDGSAGSVQALAWALYEARLRAVDLHVVGAWSYHPGWEAGRATMFGPQVGMLAGRLDPHTPSLAETARRDQSDVAAIRDILDAAIRDVQPDCDDPGSVSITSETVEGPAAKVLLDSVSESDLLVVGSRGHGAFVGALLGSVSHHVVAQAPCPVVVVPNRPSEPQP